jgi:hypothetical protein
MTTCLHPCPCTSDDECPHFDCGDPLCEACQSERCDDCWMAKPCLCEETA